MSVATDCPACNGEGGQHVCAGSGTFLAAEAHVQEDLTAPQDWPAWQVTIHCRMRAEDEGRVRTRLEGLVADLLSDDLVEHTDFSLEQV